MIYRSINSRLASLILSFFLFSSSLNGQTIIEKKTSTYSVGGDLTKDMQLILTQLNKELKDRQNLLKNLYAEVLDLYQHQAPDLAYQELLAKINTIRDEIQSLEMSWQDKVTHSDQEMGYALWHQPESTVGQLIIDYGSQNYVYIMPPEISSIKVSVDSNIPIPRASWNEMLELILNQNGVGIRQLNPYLRQLYLIKQDKSSIKLITNIRRELDYLPPDRRLCFMLSPEPAEVRRIWVFLDKFINPHSTILQVVGRDILIIGTVSEVLDLLKLYDFVALTGGHREYKIKSLNKVNADEMAKILGAIFDQLEPSKSIDRPPERPSPSLPGRAPLDLARSDKRETGLSDFNGLRIIPLTHITQAIFLVGTKDEIRKAEEIIDQVESQVGEAREKTIWWYTTKHSDPEELAQILEKVYSLIVQNPISLNQSARQGLGPLGNARENNGNRAFLDERGHTPPPPQPPEVFPNPNPFQPARLYTGDFYQQGGQVVNPKPVEPGANKQIEPNRNRHNFIVDLKTGAIVMVVEADILPKIKEVIKKLDVPKKMVQIEVLVFEKRLKRQDNFGLNLLRLGDLASNQNVASILWNTVSFGLLGKNNAPNNLGITDFILSREGSHGVPAFDLVYNFLIQQEDIQINANPTVVTMNQTAATIAIVEEISINSGVFLFNTGGGVTPERSFTRAQYGTTIVVTPTIHLNDHSNPLENQSSYVTLDTDITFDTLAGTGSVLFNNGQPDVTRRHITNQVSIPDGQTVVIGGLRRKNTDDLKNSIPYLGEIPGFGKLFSTTSMQEDSLELFIFMTPKIISDPADDFCRLRNEEMLGRPGDIPEFLYRVVEAEEREKNRLYAGTMNVLFGRPPARFVMDSDYSSNGSCYPACSGEYDGR